MDPNANILEQERLLEAPRGQRDLPRLQELRQAFRDWCLAGGFRPSAETWAACPRACRYYKINVF
jgi:hypothetical protein